MVANDVFYTPDKVAKFCVDMSNRVLRLLGMGDSDDELDNNNNNDNANNNISTAARHWFSSPASSSSSSSPQDVKPDISTWLVSGNVMYN